MGHTDTDSFKDQDKEICRQVEQLSSSIKEINSSITEITLPFNCDLKRRRKDTNRRKGRLPSVRVSYKFAAHYDGYSTYLDKTFNRRHEFTLFQNFR